MAQISQFVKQQPGTSIHNWMSQKAVTDLVQSVRDDFHSDLNGTNYLMVYGVGTPEENAAELQAAYNVAKTMPRFIGYLAPPTTTYIYAGQTFGTYIEGRFRYYKVLVDGLYTPYQMPLPEITEEEAKSVRTTVIVAPGEYNFGASAFTVDTDGINIVSLTGNSDVIVSSTEENTIFGYIYGIKVTTQFILIKGINCKTNIFYIEDYLDNLICEYCIGGDNSFGAFGTVSGTFNNCIGGHNSFGSGIGATASGVFNNCIGGDGAFGNSCTASGIFTNCKGGSASFGSYGGIISGTFNNCIGGDDSFGAYSGTIEASARLYYTRITSGTFPTPVTGGRLILCIDGDNNIVTI